LQKNIETRAGSATRLSSLLRGSTQAEAPPAIRKKVATKIAANYKSDLHQGSSRVRAASEQCKPRTSNNLRSAIAVHFGGRERAKQNHF
jgi:hypothetical protein